MRRIRFFLDRKAGFKQGPALWPPPFPHDTTHSFLFRKELEEMSAASRLVPSSQGAAALCECCTLVSMAMHGDAFHVRDFVVHALEVALKGAGDVDTLKA